MNSNLFKAGGFVLILAISPMVFADAPVVEIGHTSQTPLTSQQSQQDPQSISNQANDTSAAAAINQPQPDLIDNASSDRGTPVADLTAMPVPERLLRLEQQMANLIRMNLPEQISQLQQGLQQLQGQLQVQAHNLKLLSDQQRNFYQDIDQRLAKLKNNAAAGVKFTKQTNSSNSKSTIAAPIYNKQMQDTNNYQFAFNLLLQKKYDQAKAAFQKYLTTFPQGKFLANAHFWLGEIFALEKKYAQAAKEFNTVVKQFPKSAKVPDAQLKLAISHANMGQVKQAMQEFLQIKKRYINSTAAQLATIHLQQLQAAQHNKNNS